MLPNETQTCTPRSSITPPKASVHWQAIARRWNQVGPPLRPTAEDLAVHSSVLGRWASVHGVPRALILGVTVELYNLPWPEGTDLAAMDHTQNMIDRVWPGPPGSAICADWVDMPLETASRDIVLCDGGLSMLPYPQGHCKLVRALQRVLAPNGRCIFRLYVPPPQRETPETVLRDLLAAKIPNLNILKLRLGMALQENSEGGVQLGRIWEVLHQAAPDFSRLAARIGWPLEHLSAINTYRDCPNRYYFLTVAEVCDLFTKNPGGFELEALHVPTYALGERCPTVVLRRGEIAPLDGPA